MPATTIETPVTVGLRERKKAKTRALIQAEALRLFRQHGYEATTIEQIADAAEVSPSTFFRYFPTKEEVVLWDEFDSRLAAAFQLRPAQEKPLEALRAAFADVFGGQSEQARKEQKQRTELIVTVASLRVALLDQITRALELTVEAAAQRTGRSSDDFALRAMAGAFLGVAIAATMHLADHPGADLATLIDDGVREMANGFGGI